MGQHRQAVRGEDTLKAVEVLAAVLKLWEQQGHREILEQAMVEAAAGLAMTMPQGLAERVAHHLAAVEPEVPVLMTAVAMAVWEPEVK